MAGISFAIIIKHSLPQMMVSYFASELVSSFGNAPALRMPYHTHYVYVWPWPKGMNREKNTGKLSLKNHQQVGRYSNSDYCSDEWVSLSRGIPIRTHPPIRTQSDSQPATHAHHRRIEIVRFVNGISNWDIFWLPMHIFNLVLCGIDFAHTQTYRHISTSPMRKNYGYRAWLSCCWGNAKQFAMGNCLFDK